MPQAKFFESPETYYGTLFHELTHATGHVSRLNRKEITDPNQFGSNLYGREELVAEMGAAFLSGHCGIENSTLDQSASYIQNWLERLRNDRKLVVQAAAQAQKACDFILDVQPEDEGPVQYESKKSKIVALRECSMPASKSLQRTEPDSPVRTLKIEADGDFWKGLTKPKIRLTGHWLERAGFKPGNRVHVMCLAPGVIELRSSDNLALRGAKRCSLDRADCPF